MKKKLNGVYFIILLVGLIISGKALMSAEEESNDAITNLEQTAKPSANNSATGEAAKPNANNSATGEATKPNANNAVAGEVAKPNAENAVAGEVAKPNAENVTFTEADAKKFAEDLLKNIYNSLPTKSSPQEIYSYFATVTPNAFALSYMSIFSVGLYLKGAEDTLKEEYASLAKEYMILQYGSQFVSYYNNYNYHVDNVEQIYKNEFSVHIVVEPKNPASASDNVIDITWRIKYSDKEHKFYIIDIIVNNVSLLSAQRLTFEGKIKADPNASFTAITTYLTEEVATLKKHLGLDPKLPISILETQKKSSNDTNSQNLEKVAPTTTKATEAGDKTKTPATTKVPVEKAS